MFSGGQDGYSFFPRWNEEAVTLEPFDQRVKLFASSTKKEETYLCGPRLLSTFDPEGDTFRYVRDNLTDVQLETADGSSALLIVKTIRLSVGPKTTQEGVRLLLDFFTLNFFDEIMVNFKFRDQKRHSARKHSMYFAS